MKKLYVGNLPYRLDRGDLEEFLASCGEISELYLVRDKGKRRLKGFGFVTFVDNEGAKAALDLDGNEFYGRTIKISVAKDQSAHAEQIDEEDDDVYVMPFGFKRWLGVIILSGLVAAATSYVVTENSLEKYQFNQQQAMFELKQQQGTIIRQVESLTQSVS